MIRTTFTEEQVKELANNPYVKAVSNKSITYTDAFKVHLVLEREKGKFPLEIFREAGFPLETLGKRRINNFSSKWLKVYREKGITAVKDTRKGASGRPRLTELSTEEKLRRAEQKIYLLEQENALLKKLDFAERRGKALTKKEKFELIKQVTGQPRAISVSKACEWLEVSTSGFYSHFSKQKAVMRNLREHIDIIWRDLVVEAMAYKKVAKGSRSVVMYLKNTAGFIANRKRIQRIMRKYGLECPIRRKNPYKRLAKATQEHRTVPNQLKRNFDQGVPKKVLLTDITYLRGRNGFMGYLSTILDGATKEILAYAVSDRITLDIALNSVEDLMMKHGSSLHEEALIHSDQGSHYTSPHFQKLVKGYGIAQSMSRRGNCWDNAPQESWFGHLKDEIYFEQCESLAELRFIIDHYIRYYNSARGQWKLKKLTPVAYRNQLLQQVA